MRQGASLNSSRRIYQNIKDFLKKFFIFLKKSCQVFEQLFSLHKQKNHHAPDREHGDFLFTHSYYREYFKDISQVMLIHFYTLISFSTSNTTSAISYTAHNSLPISLIVSKIICSRSADGFFNPLIY